MNSFTYTVYIVDGAGRFVSWWCAEAPGTNPADALLRTLNRRPTAHYLSPCLVKHAHDGNYALVVPADGSKAMSGKAPGVWDATGLSTEDLDAGYPGNHALFKLRHFEDEDFLGFDIQALDLASVGQ